jgi:DNA-binding response OmpR family regulator
MTMNSTTKVFVVDDDPTTGLLLESILGDAYSLESFERPEQCLERLQHGVPDVFLLDVQMPGMDGYELCRRIKALPQSRDVPVIFLSVRDAIDDVLAGYDAGAEDYVVKPFEHVALHRKIENLLRIDEDRRSLQLQVQASEELAHVVMASLNEYAALIRFLRSLNECDDHRGVVEATLSLLDAYRLEGPVQVRMRHVERTFSRAGENWPMEIAVINHVRALGRIFEFKTRSVYNFDHITILVTNMPLDDPDRCGRIRDDMAIAAESADAKLVALQATADKLQLRAEIIDLLQKLGHHVDDYGRRYDDARYKSALHTTRLLDDLLATLANLSMSSQQEETILELVRTRSEKLIDLYDFARATSADLSALRARLEAVISTTADAVHS